MSKLIDLTGQTFGYWYVIERAENTPGGQARWLCKCTKCNETIKAVNGGHLRGGRSTACEKCRQKKMAQATIKDEKGKTYGFLYVERMATPEEKPRDRQGVYWVCTCTRCGKKDVIVFGDYLRNGDTKSCGCITVSYNEEKICKMLDQAGIIYKQQIKFKDLTSTGRPCDQLMFDFGIYENDQLSYLIEYDGEQHFKYGTSDNAFFTKEKFDITRKNDLLKNKYCFINKIPLIRIPYNKKYDLNDLILTSTRFLITPQNESGYYKVKTEKSVL